MSLGPSVAASISGLRTEAKSLLVDEGALQSKTGSHIDPDTGARIDEWTTYWSGPMRVKVSRVDQMVTAAGQQIVIIFADVSVPLDTPLISAQHRVLPTWAHDPQVVGVPLYIRTVQIGTHLVRRKLATTSDQS